MKKNIRIGVTSWDASLPPETYFGYYQTRTLSPAKFRNFTPFYADVLGENKITYHTRSQEEFDRELSYAIDAGIDYFAYVFYPDEGSREHISLTYNDCAHRVYELNYARRMHESSTLRDKIGIAAIVSKHPFTDSDVNELVDLLGKPYYETYNGRPLVYLYVKINNELIEKIENECEARGIAKPYFSVMFNSDMPDSPDLSRINAVSAYSCGKNNINTYAELCDGMIYDNEVRLALGRPVIPSFTVGWNPAPRINIPSPWYTYDKVPYAKLATVDELKEGAVRFADWIENTAKDAFIGHIVTFAWNEFEEGGWICPTYNDDLSVNEERVRAFKEISSYWKTRFG